MAFTPKRNEGKGLRVGFAAEGHDQKPDYSFDRWVKMAQELGDDVNRMVGHGDDDAKKQDKDKDKAEKEKTDKAKAEKDKADKTKADKDKEGKEKAEKEKQDKGGKEKAEKDKAAPDKAAPDKGGKEPPKPKEDKPPVGFPDVTKSKHWERLKSMARNIDGKDKGGKAKSATEGDAES